MFGEDRLHFNDAPWRVLSATPAQACWHPSQQDCEPFRKRSVVVPMHAQASRERERHHPHAKNHESPSVRRVMIQNGQSSAQQHDSILCKHGPTMGPSAQNQPLIIVFTVSLPNLFATEHPSDQSDRCIHDERGEDHGRDPYLEYSVANTKDHQCPRQESDRDAPCIAHEDTRGREIMSEKSQSGHRHEHGDDEHDWEVGCHPKYARNPNPKNVIPPAKPSIPSMKL